MNSFFAILLSVAEWVFYLRKGLTLVDRPLHLAPTPKGALGSGKRCMGNETSLTDVVG